MILTVHTEHHNIYQKILVDILVDIEADACTFNMIRWKPYSEHLRITFAAKNLKMGCVPQTLRVLPAHSKSPKVKEVSHSTPSVVHFVGCYQINADAPRSFVTQTGRGGRGGDRGGRGDRSSSRHPPPVAGTAVGVHGGDPRKPYQGWCFH